MGMGPANYIAEQTISSGAVTGGSIPLHLDDIDVMTFQNEWGGTLDAVITYEATNDPRAFPGHPDYASATWIDITPHIGPTNPAGAAGNNLERLESIGFAYIRQAVTWAAGTGTFKTITAATSK